MMRGRRLLATVASVYPISLLGVALMLRYLGERWWVAGVGLYLPRIVLGAPLPLIVIALMAAGMVRLLWTQIVAALIVLFPLMGLVLPWPILRTPDAPVLRVLSYNANSGYRGDDNIVREIDRHSPDVVLLQEIGSPESIGVLLRSRYPTVSITNQFVLASKYRILSTVNPEKLAYGGRLRSPRFVQQILDTPLGRIVFYNVHPASPRDVFYSLRGQGLRRELLSGRLFSSANSAVLQENSALRTLQMQAISEAAAREADPVVIAGDTNLPGLSLVLRRYLSKYQDGFAKAGWGFGYTFPADRGPWMRIDRVFASKQLRFVRFVVGQSLASDHFCVVADLQRGDR